LEKEFDLLHELAPKVLYPLEVAGLDLSITNSVVTMFVAATLVSAVLLIAGRKPKLIPGRFQNAIEVIVNFIRNDIVIANIGKDGMVWFPFLATLFFFILFNNILGMIPKSGAPTMRLAVPATLAVIVFLSVHIHGVLRHGPIKYMAGWVPSGVPIVIWPVIFILEAISHLAKPFSLTVRLFANIFAGHILLLVFLSFALMMGTLWVVPLTFPFAVALLVLDTMFAIIQAYVFTLLAAMYISAATHAEH
jgi:F-type H+-transporting ATPase subunit a